MVFGKHINKYYRKYAFLLLLGIVALVLVDYAQLKIPEYYRMMVNGMNDGKVTIGESLFTFDLDFLLDKICGPMMVIIVLIISCRFVWRICFFYSAIGVETGLRDEMFDHSKDLSWQYYQVNKVGDLMSLFTNDLETIQDCFGEGILMTFDAVTLGGMALLKMFHMSVSMTLLLFIPVGIMFFVLTTLSKIMNRRWDKRQAAFSSLSDFSQEAFSGIAVLKAFAAEFKELKRFEKLNKKNEKANVSYVRVSTLLQVMIGLAVESIICTILGYGGYLVHKGVFDPGMLVEYIGYFSSIVWPVMAISMLIEMRAKGKASLARVGALLDAEIDVKDKDMVKADAKVSKGEIEFKNLSFSYPGVDRECLHNLSFKIRAGERIGILGRTGSGKTTIADLLCRIYNVADGCLFVDGKDVNTIPIKALRDRIAYVPQDNFLFGDSIENNIAFSLPYTQGGLTEADQEHVRNSARMSAVHDNIEEFPLTYQTILGERGVTISGGQKQRISIARALMKESDILILDDSVSAVDTRTEKEILSNLKRLRPGLTTILIAHRISTIEHMDRILFIDDGKVVAFGSHKELLEGCEDYKALVARQMLEDEEKKKEEEV